MSGSPLGWLDLCALPYPYVYEGRRKQPHWPFAPLGGYKGLGRNSYCS